MLWRSTRVNTELPDFVRLERDDVVALLRKRQVLFSSVQQVERTRDAAGLLILGRHDGTLTCAEVSLLTESVRLWPAPSRRVYGGEGGRFYAWLDPTGDTVIFPSGETIALPRFAKFNIDPGGTYFVIGEKRTGTWLGEHGSPGRRQLLSGDLLATEVFADGQRIFVCGNAYRTNGVTGEITSAARCLVAQRSGASFRVVEKHDLPWAAGVVDKHPREDLLLVQGRGDYFGRDLFSYDMKTRRRTRLGPSEAFCFFGPPSHPLSTNRLGVPSRD